jgi:ADP-L-glycero-D-manno-heptose 6-epimerase
MDYISRSSNQPLIVVTGAAGMIGSGVVRYLNDLGKDHLLLVDDLGHGDKWKNLVGKRFVDLLSPSKLFPYLKERLEEVEAVIHLGACSDTTQTDADYLLENNFRYTIQLASLVLSANKPFIYASSAATYGDGSSGFSDDEDRLEDLRPLNMYGYSKHLVDLWMKREGVLDRVVGLKYFNVFGPNEYHKGKMASFIFKMFGIAKEGGSLSLFKSNDLSRFADGEQCRDFIYLKDAVRMTCAFLSPAFQPHRGIYNIGLGKAASWNQMAQFLFDSLGVDPRIAYVDMPKELHKQYQNYTCADVSKFLNILSSSSEKISMTPLDQAVREYVSQFLLRNSRW